MSSNTVAVEIEATIGSCKLNMSVGVPAGPARVDDFLPLLQILSNKVVDVAEADAQQSGKCISCQKGCGACCRQLVPLSPADARNVTRLVAELPEPRRSEVTERFAIARRRLEESGMWDKLNDRRNWPEAEVSKIGIDYFQLGIACPFLEDESCSIHLERPLTCREYLVTSPAELCASPKAESIECLPMPAKVWLSAARAEPEATTDRYLNWIPLIQALDWNATHPAPAATKPGPEMLRELIEGLSHTSNQIMLPAALDAPPVPPTHQNA